MDIFDRNSFNKETYNWDLEALEKVKSGSQIMKITRYLIYAGMVLFLFAFVNKQTQFGEAIIEIAIGLLLIFFMVRAICRNNNKTALLSSSKKQQFDYYLYEYHYVKTNNHSALLMNMAKLDIELGNIDRAAEALKHIRYESCSNMFKKLFLLLNIAITNEYHRVEERNRFIREYQSVKIDNRSFPKNDVVAGWMERDVSSEEIRETIEGINHDVPKIKIFDIITTIISVIAFICILGIGPLKNIIMVSEEIVVKIRELIMPLILVMFAIRIMLLKSCLTPRQIKIYVYLIAVLLFNFFVMSL